jgi:hypothetical protein
VTSTTTSNTDIRRHCQEPRINGLPLIPPISLLPSKLRLKILDEFYALAPPQIITLHAGPYTGRDDAHTDDCLGQCYIASGRTTVPYILRICRESRVVGLRHISTAFEVSQSEDLSTTPCTYKDSARGRSRCIHWDESRILCNSPMTITTRK